MARPLPVEHHHQRWPSAADGGLATLRLIRSRRVGPATFHRLLAEHGSPQAALEALPRLAREAGIEDYAPCPAGVAMAEIEDGRRAGARLICWDDLDYPQRLREIAEAPPVIWVRGNPAAADRLPVAVVGARNASSLGLRMARGLSGGLAEAGCVIIAGLARGIDTTAHEATLKTGTIAVMAGGIDRIYPSENAALAETICETGLLISEQPPRTEPVARHFPARNRIISGLSQAVVVIEAAHRSGSLITARNALDQGREVMAVPGHPMDARAAGCNLLIRDGATLVRNAQDVLTALEVYATSRDQTTPIPATPIAVQPRAVPFRPAAIAQGMARAAGAIISRPDSARAPAALDQGGPAQVEARILAMLGPSPTEENLLIRDLGMPAAMLAPSILALELAGKVQRLAGGRIALLQA